jgi:hypothetical protein
MVVVMRHSFRVDTVVGAAAFAIDNTARRWPLRRRRRVDGWSPMSRTVEQPPVAPQLALGVMDGKVMRWVYRTLPLIASLTVASASFALSFVALRDVAASTQAVPAHMAWLVPIVIDGGVLCGSAVVWAQASMHQRRSWFPVAVVAVLVVLSVIVNAAHAGPSVLAKVIAALPPLVLLATLELVAITTRLSGPVQTSHQDAGPNLGVETPAAHEESPGAVHATKPPARKPSSKASASAARGAAGKAKTTGKVDSTPRSSRKQDGTGQRRSAPVTAAPLETNPAAAPIIDGFSSDAEMLASLDAELDVEMAQFEELTGAGGSPRRPVRVRAVPPES